MAGKPQRKRGNQAQQALKDHGVVVTALVGAFVGVVVFGLLVWGVLGLTNPLIALLPPLARFSLYVGAITLAVAWVYAFVTHDGADPASMHRARYLHFRAMLADDGVGSFYANGVRRALAGIDRFFGDMPAPGDAPRLGLFPQAFGLRDPAPLWTANAYDRCLLLALLYPLLVVLLGWVVSGEVLGMEQALRMRVAEPKERAVSLVLLGLGPLLMIYGTRKGGVAGLVLGLAGLLCLAAAAVLGAGAGTLGVAFAVTGGAAMFSVNAGPVAGAGPSVGAGPSAGAGSVVFATSAGPTLAVGGDEAFAGIVSCALATVLALATVRALLQANRSGRSGLALALFSTIFLAASLAAPAIPTIGANESALTILFFFGLLTLVNAPFDWLALGISRGLLRRGLQQGGLAPLWLGLLDVLISLVLMAVLAIAVLWSAELFDWMTLRGGNPPILDPEAMLDELRRYATPGNTHYWWLYAMLFSTQIPALVNLIFGVFCLLRGIGGLNERMLASLPEEGTIEFWHKAVIATVWSFQMGAAVSIGLLSVYFLIAWVLPVLDPHFGSQLIDLLDSLRILPIRPPGSLVPQ